MVHSGIKRARLEKSGFLKCSNLEMFGWNGKVIYHVTTNFTNFTQFSWQVKIQTMKPRDVLHIPDQIQLIK